MGKGKKNTKVVIDFDSFKESCAPKEEPVKPPRKTFQQYERPPPSEGPIDLQRGGKQQSGTTENRSATNQEFQRGVKQSPTSTDGPRNLELQRGVKQPMSNGVGSEQPRNLNFERGVKQQEHQIFTRQSDQDKPFERGVKSQTNIDVEDQNQGQYNRQSTSEFRRGVEQPQYNESDQNFRQSRGYVDSDRPFERGGKIQNQNNENNDEGRHYKEERHNQNLEFRRGVKQNHDDDTREAYNDKREFVRGLKQPNTLQLKRNSNNFVKSDGIIEGGDKDANSDNDQNVTNDDDGEWTVVTKKKKKDQKKNIYKIPSRRERKSELPNEYKRNINRPNVSQDDDRNNTTNDENIDNYSDNEDIIDNSDNTIDVKTIDNSNTSDTNESSINTEGNSEPRGNNIDTVPVDINVPEKTESIPKGEIPAIPVAVQINPVQPEVVEQSQTITLAQRLSEKPVPKIVPETQKEPKIVNNDSSQNTVSRPSIEELKKQAEEKLRREQLSGTSYFYPHISLPMPTIIETFDEAKKLSLTSDIKDIISDFSARFIKVVMDDLKLTSSQIVEFICLLITHMFTALSDDQIVRNIIRELIDQKYINYIHLICSFQIFYTNMEDYLIDFPKAKSICNDLLKHFNTVQILEFTPSHSDNKIISDFVNYFLNLTESEPEPSEQADELILFSFVTSLFVSQNNTLFVPVQEHEKCHYIPFVVQHRDYLFRSIGNFQVEKQVNILQKAVELIFQLGFPDNVLESFFYTLYDTDIIREPAFISWYELYSEKEEYSKAKKQLSEWFVWLRNADYR